MLQAHRFFGSGINGNLSCLGCVRIDRSLTASSEAELMETLRRCARRSASQAAHRFFGSGINGNPLHGIGGRP